MPDKCSMCSNTRPATVRTALAGRAIGDAAPTVIPSNNTVPILDPVARAQPPKISTIDHVPDKTFPVSFPV